MLPFVLRIMLSLRVKRIYTQAGLAELANREITLRGRLHANFTTLGKSIRKVREALSLCAELLKLSGVLQGPLLGPRIFA